MKLLQRVILIKKTIVNGPDMFPGVPMLCRQLRFTYRAPTFFARHDFHLSAITGLSPGSNDGDLYEKFADLEKNEDMEFEAYTYSQSYNEMEAEGDKKKLERVLKWKILKRKYYSPPPEHNLLTWDAKEQIRYLNHEYPQEWTIDRLSESFPVSRDGIIKILKSSYTPRDMQEIARHDKRVKKTWQLLSEKGGREGGPVALLYEGLVNNNNLEKMKHAAGLPGLPVPERKLLVSGLKEYDSTRKIGPFEALVREDTSQMSRTSRQSDRIESGSLTGKSLCIIDDQVKDLLNRVAYPEGQAFENDQTDKSLWQHDQNQTENRNQVKQIKSQINANDAGPTSQSLGRKSRRVLRGKDWGAQAMNVESNENGLFAGVSNEKEFKTLLDVYQQKGTGKLTKIKDENDTPATGTSASRIESMQNENLKATLKSNVSLTPGSSSVKALDTAKNAYLKKMKYDRDPYVYDYETGYQKPFGSEDPTVDDIDVKNMAFGSKAKFYQKGNVIYDENGEFLMKIPS